MANGLLAKRRWKLLGDAISGSSQASDPQDDCSRKPKGRFGLIPCHRSLPSADIPEAQPEPGEAVELTEDIVYILPRRSADRDLGCAEEDRPHLLLRQRRADAPIALSEHTVSLRCGVDNTGNVCLWPSEEVLAHVCCAHARLFRGKNVIELGAGYGLAGMAVAACTGASRVLLTDGNPLVVERLSGNIQRNARLFGPCQVSAELLPWADHGLPHGGEFDVLIASDCTFFKDYHRELVNTICWLLRDTSNQSAGHCRGPSPDEAAPSSSVGGPADAVHDPANGTFVVQGTAPGVADGGHHDLAIQLRRERSEVAAGVCATQGTENLVNPTAPSQPCQDGPSGCHQCAMPLDLERGASWDGASAAHEESNGLAPPAVESGLNGARWMMSPMLNVPDVPIALLLNPPRGGTLDAFMSTLKEHVSGSLEARLWTKYDDDVWQLHQSFLHGSSNAWPGYDVDFCYPLLLTISRASSAA
eukprot:jgi/Mesvir1/28057/Mv04657-RA.1